MKKSFILFFVVIILICSCSSKKNNGNNTSTNQESTHTNSYDANIGDDLDNSLLYDGYFEDARNNVIISCISGTQNAYSIENNIITFTTLDCDSVYSISGQLKGNIIIDIGDAFKFELELQGFSLCSDNACPIEISSGSKASICAKKGFKNYIYDMREAVDSSLDGVYSGAIHSVVDLELCGKGELTIVSKNNNGVHTKDDLTVKNLTLNVACLDNSLKGNDSVTIESGNLILIATQGDGIKTSNSDISSKGKQRGNIEISGGIHYIYSSCDGIDASYNVLISNDAILNIYTDKYSSYSVDSEQSNEKSEDLNYILFSSKSYSYSVKYYNSDADYTFVNATYHSSISQGPSNLYYYSFPKLSGYSKVKYFIYSNSMAQGQEESYIACTDYLTINESYDTFYIVNRGGYLGYSFINYTTSIQGGGFGGMGGMNEGNSDKGTYSTKGIKATNEIIINGGVINVCAYDDALHSGTNDTLENDNLPLGNITINSGNITIFSNDDGIHADANLIINGGTVNITGSYEGFEASYVNINDGNISIISKDDGINSTASSNTGVKICGGRIYIHAGGDGIDSNSRTSYSGIVFSGGDTVVISTSGGNSAIDTEQGYSYTGGRVIAIMPSGAMTSEATHTQSFSSIGSKLSVSANTDKSITVRIGSTAIASIKMPSKISGTLIYLGDSSAQTTNSSNFTYDTNGVYWK